MRKKQCGGTAYSILRQGAGAGASGRAIRLLNNAFRANAGTDVVSDIIFLQKRDRSIEIEPDWVHTGIRRNPEANADGFASISISSTTRRWCWGGRPRKARSTAGRTFDDIREKLVAGGIPSEEVAFIHEANTETRRKSCLQKSAVTAAASGFTEGGEDAKSEKMMQNSTITAPSKQTAQ